MLSIINLWPDMEGGKVGLGEKEWFFRKKRIKINVVSRNCIELIAVIFIHATSIFCLIAPIHE